jgi:hypothetical protein
VTALATYAADVRARRFPSDEESYHLSEEVSRQLVGEQELVVGLYGQGR